MKDGANRRYRVGCRIQCPAAKAMVVYHNGVPARRIGSVLPFVSGSVCGVVRKPEDGLRRWRDMAEADKIARKIDLGKIIDEMAGLDLLIKEARRKRRLRG